MILRNSVILLFYLICVGISHAAQSTDYTRLKRNLMEGYDLNIRPSIYHTNSTILEFAVIVHDIDFDDRKSVMTLDTMTWMRWQDDHLTWDPLQYGNITTMIFANHEVWQPDLTVFNNYRSDVDHYFSTRVLVNNTGSVTYVPPATYQVRCGYPINIRKWPYDTQKCKIIFGSWAHNGDELTLRPLLYNNVSKLDFSEWVANREWKVVDSSIVLRNYRYPSTVKLLQDVLINITLQRYSETHTAGVVGPGIAIAVAILVCFWIPPGAIERLVLLLFLMVLNSLFTYYVYTVIPNNGQDVPLMLLYYRDSLFMISFALAWTVGLRYLAAAKRSSPVPLPGFIQTFLESWISKVLCLDPRPNTSASSVEEGVSGDEGKLVGESGRYQADWAWLAHLLDRIAFAIYLAVYIIFILAFL